MAKKVNTDSYRELQAKLDDAVALLESGDIGVDDAVKAYEAALKIIKQLEQHLLTAENQVRQLAKTYAVDEKEA